MEWDFTPEDVLNGKAHYSVAEFKKDLYEEVLLRLVDFHNDEKYIQLYFTLTIMICASIAFGKSTDSFEASIKKNFPNQQLQKFLTNKKFLKQTRDNNSNNIEMLKAVIRKRMKDDISLGIEPYCITKTITSELMTF